MAFEKAKVLKAAEKFLAQGKINAAIKEYRQIVEHDDTDFTTLNMLGDLYVRAGKQEEAISCFERIAEHYSTQEFNLKAIAMYRKVERLKPRDRNIAGKLAELYASQGLVVDARAQYLIVADAYTRAGDNRKALDVLHRIADLDPNNTDIRLKLAEGYLKEEMRREAASAYAQAADHLHQTASHEKALDAYNRALELVPDDIDILRGFLETHIARGTADEAAEALEKVVADRQHDGDLVSMLARAYLEAEDPKGAERATVMLMAQDASNYIKYLPVTRLYLKTGEIDETVRILSTVIERMLAGREERELLEIVNLVLERNPDHVAGLRMLVRIHWWQRDMDALRSALERLAEAAEAAELVDEERYALTQLARLAPDEQRYLERLNLLGGLQEETADDFSVPEPVAEVPRFETFATPEDEAAVEDAVPVSLETGSFETTPNTFSDPTASFADLNETPTETEFTFQSADQDFQEVDFGKPAGPSISPTSSDVDEQRLNSMMHQELESVDFYIAQGYFDIAIDTLQMLERQFGAQPDIVARREKLDSTGTTPKPPEVFEFGGPEELTIASQQESATDSTETAFASFAEPVNEPAPLKDSSPTPSVIDTGLAEVFEEFRAAAEEDTGSEDYETHYNMGTAYKEMDLIDEAIQEFQTAATLVQPSDGTSRFLQCCNMLGHCFMQQGLPEAALIWFKKGLSAPGLSEDEYQALRYELGNAYEQAGDVQNAKQLYTEVYGVDVAYREVAEKLRKLGKAKNKGPKNKAPATD
jgi:tetratricopeptide (TPR) repeat protein